MPNLRKRIRDLEEVMRAVRDDLNLRAKAWEYENPGDFQVAVGESIWRRFNETLDQTEPEIAGIPSEKMTIPDHHKQWFEQLKKAGANGDLALMACLDAKTFEPRTVLALVGHDNGDYVLTPVGHLCPEDNPYEAYLPPRTEEDISR